MLFTYKQSAQLQNYETSIIFKRGKIQHEQINKGVLGLADLFISRSPDA